MLSRVKMSDNEPIKFQAAIVYARKITPGRGLVRAWSVHRAQWAKLDTGFLVIEQEWFPKGKAQKK